MDDLFDSVDAGAPAVEELSSGAMVLRGFAAREAPTLLEALQRVIDQAPLRHMVTPGGFRMAVAMTNCGSLGWVSDRRGYRYTASDPVSELPWPPMPASFHSLATRAAAAAGFARFEPDACLVNRYGPGARLSLHQDRDENDYDAPIVSVSLGVPAVFLFGGGKRSDRQQRVPLVHGDVVVWGGPARLRFHGVKPLASSHHPSTGPFRYNLTLRKAG